MEPEETNRSVAPEKWAKHRPGARRSWRLSADGRPARGRLKRDRKTGPLCTGSGSKKQEVAQAAPKEGPYETKGSQGWPPR